MFDKSNSELQELGAAITTQEIKQQPKLWQETYNIYKESKEQIDTFLQKIVAKHDRVRIIFTGAGTSAFVGETVAPYIQSTLDQSIFDVRAIPTTSIVATPELHLDKDTPTLLVSFARSGNSPESVKTIELAKEIVTDLYQLTITCAEEGKLAQSAIGDKTNYSLLMPEGSNDKGFAMTGAYTCMTLATVLVFSKYSEEELDQYVNAIIDLGNEVVASEDIIKEALNRDFNRVVYLGSGVFEGLARESHLKVLELTAGDVNASYESSLGFRHGPKSVVNANTIVFGFVSNNDYTRLYDLDLLNEVNEDKIAANTFAIQTKADINFEGNAFTFESGNNLPDVFLVFPFVMFAQTVSLLASVAVNNKPDTPSPSGTVNRVVKGVILHDYKKGE